MAYKDILSEAIKNSELPLREIADRCSILGIPISASYLSQLQTGKLPPPSEEVSKAIAQVCNLPSSEELVIEGYMEKAPEIIRDYLTATSEVNKQALTILGEELNKNLDPKYIEYMSLFTRLSSSVSYLEKLKRAKGEKHTKSTYGLVKDKYSDMLTDDMQEIYIQDASMEPLIPKGSKLNIRYMAEQDLADKDIVAVKYKNKITARRYYKIGELISLIPENKDFEIINVIDFSELEYYGKALSYTASLK